MMSLQLIVVTTLIPPEPMIMMIDNGVSLTQNVYNAVILAPIAINNGGPCTLDLMRQIHNSDV